MNNTALSARVRSTKKTHMVFVNRQHEKFNYEKSGQAKCRDCYYKVLMYILGNSKVARGINLHYQKFCHRQKSMEEIPVQMEEKKSAENSVNGNKK